MLAERPRTPSARAGVMKVSASPVTASVVEWWIAVSRVVCRASDAGLAQTASLPVSDATVACPWPRVRAPTGSSRNSAVSLCARAAGNAAASASASAALAERRRLIYEHDRNVVAHRVLERARVADESAVLFPVLELALALWADEDLEKLLRHRHMTSSCDVAKSFYTPASPKLPHPSAS